MPMLPLVSVMMADGRPNPAEKAYVQQLIEALNSPPVPPDMMRVHEPQDVPMPRTERARQQMIESMVRLVHLDQRRSDVEMKIVRKFADAWGVDGKKVAEFDREHGKKHSGGLKRLGRFFKRR
jgi:uncharacterized tellurite resistance protein B-like protein